MRVLNTSRLIWTAIKNCCWIYGLQTISVTCQHSCKAHATKFILCDWTVSSQHRLCFFHAVVSIVVCYTGRHRTASKQALHNLDVTCPVARIGQNFGMKVYATHLEQTCSGALSVLFVLFPRVVSKMSEKAHWKNASYTASLPAHRWVVRVLRWQPIAFQGAWDDPRIQSTNKCFRRWQGMGDWFTDAFVDFGLQS